MVRIRPSVLPDLLVPALPFRPALPHHPTFLVVRFVPEVLPDPEVPEVEAVPARLAHPVYIVRKLSVNK